MGLTTNTKTLICPHCGGKKFTLSETLVWKVWTDDEHEETAAKNTNCEVSEIVYDGCGKDVTEYYEEQEIDINFS